MFTVDGYTLRMIQMRASLLLAVLIIVAVAAGKVAFAQVSSDPLPISTPGLKRPEIVKQVIPAYPPVAQAARISGATVVEATIDRTGAVQSARVTRAIPLLDSASLEAVRQMRFTPGILDGVPVPVKLTATFRFVLRRGNGVPPFSPTASSIKRSSWVPRDFAIYYWYDCPRDDVVIDSARGQFSVSTIGDTAAAKPNAEFRLSAEEEELIFLELVRRGFFEAGDVVTTWREASSSVSAREDGLEVLVLGEEPRVRMISVYSSQASTTEYYAHYSHRLDVRSYGSWRRIVWGEPVRESAPEHAQQMSRAGELIREIVLSKSSVRALRRNQRSCDQ